MLNKGQYSSPLVLLPLILPSFTSFVGLSLPYDSETLGLRFASVSFEFLLSSCDPSRECG